MAARKKTAKKKAAARPAKKAKKAAKKAAKTAKKAAKTTKKVAKVAKKKATTKAKPAPKPKTPKAPLVWTFATKTSAFGIYVDDNLAWVGNSDGEIFAITHAGEVQHKFKLPDGVKCLIADERWRYAGCDDGNVYDLTGRVPRVVYEIKKGVDILWLDIFRGNLCVSDAADTLTVIDAEDQLKWKKSDPKTAGGWMVRADASGIYNGGNSGITKFDWEGKKLWKADTSMLMFGWQEADAVYGGTTNDEVVCVSKDGKKGAIGKCDESVLSCAAAPGGKYMFGGGGCIYCFDDAGKRLWKMETGCGSALSMQYFKEKLYIVTTDGTLACIDVSEEAIAAAAAGQARTVEQRKAPKVEAQSTELEATSDTSKGVVVECVKEGSKLRVRVISDGYHKDWFCQFPKDIREAGARYVVDEVVEATQGGFYRVIGDIKRLT